MLDTGKPTLASLSPYDAAEVSMAALREALAANPGKRLVFHYEGQSIRSGYHITEVKSGSFVALDCGGNPENWSELFIQLLDVAGDGPHMPAGKFAAIIGKVAEHFALDSAAKLTFEVSDGIEPVRLFMAATPTVTANDMQIDLVPRPASCKPRDRWLAQERAAAASECCLEPKTELKQRCCG